MKISPGIGKICVAALATWGMNVSAESFTSSASSAGSASSGSMSASLRGSSNSSDNDHKTANGNYQILDIAAAPDHPGTVRITMASREREQRGQGQEQVLALDLPAAVFAQQRLTAGDLVHAQPRAYGVEFARADTGKAFFLVLSDDWFEALPAKQVVHS